MIYLAWAGRNLNAARAVPRANFVGLSWPATRDILLVDDALDWRAPARVALGVGPGGPVGLDPSPGPAVRHRGRRRPRVSSRPREPGRSSAACFRSPCGRRQGWPSATSCRAAFDDWLFDFRPSPQLVPTPLQRSEQPGRILEAGNRKPFALQADRWHDDPTGTSLSPPRALQPSASGRSPPVSHASVSSGRTATRRHSRSLAWALGLTTSSSASSCTTGSSSRVHSRTLMGRIPLLGSTTCAL